MIRDRLTQLLEEVSKNHASDDLYQAKKEFQKYSGTIFDDDKSYESRMGTFLEWFTFDRWIPGSDQTPLHRYLNDNKDLLPAETLELGQSLTQAVHGLFVIKKVRDDHVLLEDLIEGKKYKIVETQGEILFNKHDIVEGRIISLQDKFYLTDNLCYHPQQTANFIKSKIKALKKEENGFHDTLKQWTKERAKLEKKRDKVSSQLAKLSGKLEKTQSEDKKAVLNRELEKLVQEKADWDRQISELSDKMADFEHQNIRIGIPENRFRLIRKLSYMSLKWERSRKIDVRDIYRD